MKASIKAFVCSFLLLSAAPVLSYASGIEIQHFTLGNGMEGYFIPNHKVPAVAHSVWYRAGAGEDPYGKSGIAHFLEHMMFRGSGKIEPGEFSKIISRNGGRDNAFTSYDLTAYFQTIGIQKLPMVMEMEAERMKGALLDKAQFDNEKKVIFEERRQTMENNPARILYDEVSALLYRNHVYGRPVIGFADELKSLSVDDLKAFYNRYYCPSNSMLIVSGDATLDEVKNMAQQYYGKIPACEKNVRVRNSVPEMEANRFAEMESALVKQPLWLRLYIAPSQSTEGKEHGFPLLLLTSILGEDKTGRLYHRLVEQEKIATAAAADYDNVSLNPTHFGISVTPVSLDKVPAIGKAVEDELKKIISSPVSDEELARSKNALIAQVVYAREGLFNLVRAAGFALTAGLDADFINTWDKSVEAVTKEQVQAAAKYAFENRHFAGGIMKPAVKVEGAKNEK